MKKDTKGFTLSETLLTVTILVILFALAIPAVFSIQKNLRQKELDDKAQIIYTACQNRLSELYTTGNSSLYNPSLNDDILPVNDFPGDYDDTIDGNRLTKDSVYYVTSDSVSGKTLFEGVFDETLFGQHWVVEIIPYVIDEDDNSKQITAATVYAVYYSEDVINVNETYATNGQINDSYLNAYRFKNRRIASVANGGTDARVGYYGGSSLGSSSGTSNLAITDIQIYSNQEVETAVVKARKPGSVSGKAEFTFKLSDAYGHSYIITYDDVTKRFVADGIDITSKKTIKVSRIGVNFTFTFTLDDLSNEGTRFNSLYGENSGHGNNNLVSGSDIKLQASITSEDKTASSDSKYALGNSLFAYTDNDIKDVTRIDTALISCARHLQNLDSSSNVTSDIKNSTLLNDISFKEDGDFYSEYKDAYFNGLLAVNKINTNGSISNISSINFKGISNQYITKFNGANYSILNLTTNTGGLFDNVSSTLQINDLKLIGEKINSSANVGSFVGTIKNTGVVTIENCSSFISSTNNDIPSIITSDMNLESFRFLQGSIVGGLVGTNNGSLIIESSFSSSVLGKSGGITGGLVGVNNGSLTINKAYSDSYLYGLNVSGLVGINNKTLNINSAYAAGFIGLDNDTNSLGAGLVLGDVTSLKDAYTIIACYNLDSDNGIKKNSNDSFIGKYYSTCYDTDSFNNLYYLRGSTSDKDNIGKGVSDGKQMSFSTSSGLTINTSYTTIPYKLMGQSLTSYTYPRFKDLDHYGDWDVSFVSGALVYYEKYKTSDDTYFGFDGAGVDISLTGNDTIIGDGYGVIVKESQSSIPDGFTVKINGNIVKTINTKNDSYYVAKKYNETYRIYPLDKADININNAIDGYYQRVTISSSTDDIKYFDFNPHFARTVVDVDSENSPISNIPNEISIRSPRHLNNLSKYYDNSYKKIIGDKTYRQERDMLYSSYDWNNYTNLTSVTSQEPIGRDDKNVFSATYDGGCYTIGDLSFITSSGYYVGMFGYSNGTIKNVVLATQYTTDGNSYRVQRSEAARTNETVYYGILVGKNSGNISNCAVAGYYLSGKDGTIHGYANSTIYVGGLVGYNEGSISDCAGDGPKLSLSMYRANCYAAGLVGYNTGTISNSYALNHLTSDVSEGKTIIAGFVAYNSGSIKQSYCATALTSSGNGSYAYAFGPSEDAGSVSDSYYLYNGSYEFVDGLYAYDRSDSSSVGSAKKYQEFKDMRGNHIAKKSLYNKLTNALDENETVYPYTAIIKDSSGNYVHYGEWQVKPSLGVFGVFYWEKEINGQNNGYKITYIGTSYGKVNYRSTLCDSHDDGGEISEYGYGYYVGEDYEGEVTYSLKDIAMSSNDNINTEAKVALESQIPGIKFYPHTTNNDNENDYIYLSGKGNNGTITLSRNDESYTFEISPFFGNALSIKIDNYDGDNTLVNNSPGLTKNPYEIRSAKQLQFINWNNASKDSTSLVTANNYKTYNYLVYATVTSKGIQTLGGAGNSEAANYIFNQTHDLNAENIKDFSPIAGQGSGTSTTDKYTAKLLAWFGGTYNGQSYKIQELNITSDAFSVGLFGTTAGAEIENVILYSTKGAVIERSTQSNDEQGAYSLGGLIGVAYDYKTPVGNAVTNCAIAGYKIIDNSKNQQGLGEANVGGLIGVSNVNVEKCSSVVDIEINATHMNGNKFTTAKYGNYIRVGGIAGAVQNEVTNCYSGGSITVGEDTLDETYNGSNHISQKSTSTASRTDSTNVFLSGIAGGAFTMNYQNFTNAGENEVFDGTPNVKNCYTYIKFPAMKGTIRNITMFASVADRYEYASSTVTNCYYLESSADIDTSSLPSYKLNSKYSVSDLMDKDHKQSMITGSAKWMYRIFTNLTEKDQGTFTKVNPKSYAELSSSNMISTLGSAFSTVTSNDESGQKVDGKYSFPAGESSLAGKNYPFPAVVTQTGDAGFISYVHYGTWPFNGAYWQKGVDTLDIFANMESGNDPYAYKEFILKNNNDEHLSKNFSIEIDEDYVELVKNGDSPIYRINDDGDYIIRLKALKTGTSTIKAIWGDNKEYSAEFILTVTANLNVEAKPNSFVLANNAKGESLLSAVSKEDTTKEYSKSSKLTWTALASTNISKDGDIEAVMQANICKIRSYGLNAQITVTATYNYHGQSFSASTIINVLRNSSIGLSDSSSYNEADILNVSETSRTINGNDISGVYDSTTGPTNTSKYFLYEINGSDFFKTNADNIIIQATTSDGSPINNLEIESPDLNNISDNANGFKTIPFDIYYYSKDSNTTINGKITATIITGNDTYVLTLDNVTINPKSFKLTLDANGGEFRDGNTIDLSLNEDIDLSSLETKPTKVGYVLAGWYSDKECNEANKVERITYENVNSNLTLYAKWEPFVNDINFDKNDGSEEASRIIKKSVAYDSNKLVFDDISRDGYTFVGWTNSDGDLIIDSSGSVLNQEQFNNLILEGNDVTLYAKWTSLKVIFKAKTENEDIIFNSKDVCIDDTNVNISLTDIDSSYSLEGWYYLGNDSYRKVLDENGDIVATNLDGFIKDGKFINNDQNLELYAKWIKTKSAYVLTDKFDDDKSYVLATSNDGSVYAINSNLEGTSVTIQTDIKGNEYIETNDSNILWTYSESKLQINNKYLYGYYSGRGWYSNYSIELYSNGSSWNYVNYKLYTTSNNKNVYVNYNSWYSQFDGSSSGSNIYLYTLGDIKLETFEYVKADSKADNNESNENSLEQVNIEIALDENVTEEAVLEENKQES